MARITYYLTDSSHLSEIEVTAGNLLFCEDVKRIYLDGNNGRVCYDSIMIFETDADRISYTSPIEGFYFVEETKIMWRYSNEEWIAITEPPTNNVIFIPYSELPEEGQYAVLYVCDKEFYIWNPTEMKYEKMNSDSVWHEV